jgi:hypothetical protein
LKINPPRLVRVTCTPTLECIEKGAKPFIITPYFNFGNDFRTVEFVLTPMQIGGIWSRIFIFIFFNAYLKKNVIFFNVISSTLWIISLDNFLLHILKRILIEAPRMKRNICNKLYM